MNTQHTYKYLAKTFAGLEEVLSAEMKELGFSTVRTMQRAVSFVGDKKSMYVANYTLRTALRVMKHIGEIDVSNERSLYRGIYAIDWAQYLKGDMTFAVDAVGSNASIRHTGFAALKVKDGIVDKLKETTGTRPSVSKISPDLNVHLHIHANKGNLYLDGSGEPLFKRGYRLRGGMAPLNEVLAAGIIKLTGWKGNEELMDPMCGSGTLLIEAACSALNIPAGYFRKDYGFMNWLDYDADLWNAVVKEYSSRKSPRIAGIRGSDISSQNLSMASLNIDKAGLKNNISLRKTDFFRMLPGEKKGVIICNPPYEERIKTGDINEFYKTIGDTLKKRYPGWKVWIFTAEFGALKHVGLRTSRKIPLFNGPLESKLVLYELYEGSKKASN